MEVESPNCFAVKTEFNHQQPKTAMVEVLIAEVRVLMVGSRQITLSVFRQLDFVPWGECEPMGRVNDNRDDDSSRLIVGRAKDGSLVRAKFPWRKRPVPWNAHDESD